MAAVLVLSSVVVSPGALLVCDADGSSGGEAALAL
jgi:hypothetical protein